MLSLLVLCTLLPSAEPREPTREAIEVTVDPNAKRAIAPGKVSIEILPVGAGDVGHVIGSSVGSDQQQADFQQAQNLQLDAR